VCVQGEQERMFEVQSSGATMIEVASGLVHDCVLHCG
jgi:hypothetical protein